MLIMDITYSLCHFQYTYIFELKRRFVTFSSGLPPEYKKYLQTQIIKENGELRTVIQSMYIPWVIFCLLLQLWYLPLILTGSVAITNLIYSKPYISPYVLLLNLIMTNCCFGFSILTLVFR